MASKSVWDLPGGPWKRVFSGVWNNFNVAVYENEEGILMTTVFPKANEVGWIMVRVDKILMVPRGIEKIEGDLEDKNLHILKQEIPGRKSSYLIILTPPILLEFGSKELGSSVFQKVLELEQEEKEIRAIAEEKGVELFDLRDAPKRENANILGNPPLLLSLLSVAPEGEEPKKRKLKQIVVGEDEAGVVAVEENLFENFVSIKKGDHRSRAYIAQILIESAIIDPGPIPIILDCEGYNLKLDQPNPYPYDYERYGLEFKNTAFSVEFMGKEGVPAFIIDLNSADIEVLWRIFGLGTDEASTLLLETLMKLREKGKITDLQQIRSAVEGQDDGWNKARSLRILGVLEKIYAGILGGESNLRGVIERAVEDNKAVYIPISDLSNQKRLALILYLLEEVEGMKRSKELSVVAKRRLDYIYPVFLGMDWFGRGLIQSEIIKKLVSRRGGLFVTEKSLPPELEGRILYRFEALGGERAKFYTGGRGKKFSARPLLSCPP